MIKERGCPDCEEGFFMVVGENKFNVTCDNLEIRDKVQSIVDKNVTCDICYCLNCSKIFVNLNYNEEKIKVELEELRKNV